MARSPNKIVIDWVGIIGRMEDGPNKQRVMAEYKLGKLPGCANYLFPLKASDYNIGDVLTEVIAVTHLWPHPVLSHGGVHIPEPYQFEKVAKPLTQFNN